MKKEYFSPEFELNLFKFENLLSTVKDSYQENSGWDKDDDRDE